MVDPRSLQTRIERLRQCISLLRLLALRPREQLLADPILWSAVERNLEVACECVLDLGNQILAELDVGSPQDYKDIFRLLVKAGALSREEGLRYEGWAGFRNVLVHQYLDVDQERVLRVLKDELEDLDRFVGVAARYL